MEQWVVGIFSSSMQIIVVVMSTSLFSIFVDVKKCIIISWRQTLLCLLLRSWVKLLAINNTNHSFTAPQIVIQAGAYFANPQSSLCSSFRRAGGVVSRAWSLPRRISGHDQRCKTWNPFNFFNPSRRSCCGTNSSHSWRHKAENSATKRGRGASKTRATNSKWLANIFFTLATLSCTVRWRNFQHKHSQKFRNIKPSLQRQRHTSE